MENHQWRRGMWQPETLRLAGDFAEPMRSGDKRKLILEISRGIPPTRQVPATERMAPISRR
jgi:hypothetical protein